MKPALRRLSTTCRAISYSLCGDIGSRRRFDPTLGFDNFMRQLDAVLDEAGVRRAAICGISFGGLVALQYAATRPDRVSALVLASAPGPAFRPNAQQARWLAKPWRSVPAFLLTSPLRVWPEIRTAIPRRRGRVAFVLKQSARFAAAPLLPSLMAARMRGAAAVDFCAACRQVQAPALIVSGEEGLDRVVPVSSTQSYERLLPRAEYRLLERTGHMGSLTQPDRFADIVTGFVHAHHH
jgi:pimeloyl-ACP methyl ester carboxylesterase